MRLRSIPLAAPVQENDRMRPLAEIRASTELEEDTSLRDALAWHGGDAEATIATLLADCAYLRHQLALTRTAMGRGFVRGWEPGLWRE